MTKEQILNMYNESYKFSELKNKKVQLARKPESNYIYFVEMFSERMEVSEITKEGNIIPFEFKMEGKRTFWDKLFNRPVEVITEGRILCNILPSNLIQNEFYIKFYSTLNSLYLHTGIKYWFFAIRNEGSVAIKAAYLSGKVLSYSALLGVYQITDIPQIPVFAKRTPRRPSDIRNFLNKKAISEEDVYVIYKNKIKKLSLNE